MALAIEKIKKQLLSRRETLVSGLRSMTSQLVEQEFSYTDSIDQASADVDRSLSLQMKDRDRQLLRQIDEALNQIKVGSFGECKRCGEEIAEARLQAFPLAVLCIECQSEVEVEGQRFLVKETSMGGG